MGEIIYQEKLKVLKMEPEYLHVLLSEYKSIRGKLCHDAFQMNPKCIKCIPDEYLTYQMVETAHILGILELASRHANQMYSELICMDNPFMDYDANVGF